MQRGDGLSHGKVPLGSASLARAALAALAVLADCSGRGAHGGSAGAACRQDPDCATPLRCYVAADAGSSAKGECLMPSAQCVPPMYCPCPGTMIWACDAPPGYQNAPIDHADLPRCARDSDCASPTRCYFALAEGCSATGVCLAPAASVVGSCKSPSYCSCDGKDVSDCTSPWPYQPVPVAHGGPCNDAPAPCSSGSSGGSPGSGTESRSCQSGGRGLSDCGTTCESCCATLEVPGGTYYRTYDVYPGEVVSLAADGGPSGEADPATVSTFRLDKYLVTVGRFRQFVAAWDGGSGLDGGAGYLPPEGLGKHTHLNGGLGLVNAASPATYESGWVASDDGNIAPTNANLGCIVYPTWTASPGDNEHLPIDCVNWWEAYAFCIWDGGFLPSEAEWEYAAAGGSQQREYPWGSTDPGTGNGYAIYGAHYTGNVVPLEIAPVGTPTLGAGRWGQLDLAGDVW
jgi:sulfatase modifying factor 1